jgi:hypothetical protein
MTPVERRTVVFSTVIINSVSVVQIPRITLRQPMAADVRHYAGSLVYSFRAGSAKYENA